MVILFNTFIHMTKRCYIYEEKNDLGFLWSCARENHPHCFSKALVVGHNTWTYIGFPRQKVLDIFDNSPSPITIPNRNASLMLHLPLLPPLTTPSHIGYSLAFAFLPHAYMSIPFPTWHSSHWRHPNPQSISHQHQTPLHGIHLLPWLLSHNCCATFLIVGQQGGVHTTTLKTLTYHSKFPSRSMQTQLHIIGIRSLPLCHHP